MNIVNLTKECFIDVSYRTKDAQSVMGSNVSKFLAQEDQRVFTEATEELLADDSRTVEVRFNMMTSDDDVTEMEGKGMLMYNRVTGEPSHTMWVIKPVSSRRWSLIERMQPSTSTLSTKYDQRQSIDDEQGAQAIMRHRSMSEPPNLEPPTPDEASMEVQEEDQEDQQGTISRETVMSLPPVLCHVCERWVVAAFFEQHSELCIEIHRTEMEVNICNDNLRDLRFHVLEVSEKTKNDIASLLEGKTPESDTGSIKQDTSDQDSIYGADSLPIEQGPTPLEEKRAELDIYTDLLSILDVALGIAMPGRSDDDDDEIMHEDEDNDRGKPHSLQSPRSKSKMVQILYWRPPAAEGANTLSLIREVERLTRKKVDVVNRMRDHLEYNERARTDFQKTMQQEAGWSEFVPSGNDDTATTKQSQDYNVDKRSPQKRGLLSKLRLWKSKGVDRLARRHRRKQGRKCSTSSSTTPAPTPPPKSARPSDPSILEAEMIETPVASPGLRPQKSKDLSTGKSPLSPLQAFIPPRPTPPSIKDFDIIKPISKGAFGSVFLAKKRSTGDYYAIKFLKKSDMIAKNQVMNVKAERMILMTQTDSPFVTKLYYTFQSKDYLYLVLEYLNGGDCSALVKVLGSLPEDWARNYLAEVTLGLQFLHDKNVIHR